jgi:hypothetical protein
MLEEHKSNCLIEPPLEKAKEDAPWQQAVLRGRAGKIYSILQLGPLTF